MNKISLLVDKYFEGLTSLEEEACLREYFLQEEVPEELALYKPIFHCISRERGDMTTHKPEIRKAQLSHKIWAYASAVAILIGLAFFFIPEYLGEKPVSLVYIDGKAYTDTKSLQEQVLQSLDGISSEESDILESQIDILNLLQE